MVVGGLIIIFSFIVPEQREGDSFGFMSQGIGWLILGYNGFTQFKKFRRSRPNA